MRKEEWTSKDGSKSGVNCFPENGDEFTIVADKVGEGEERLGVNSKTGQPFKTKDYFLKVATTSGEEVVIKLTGGQAKLLNGKGDIKGKKLVFELYDAKFTDANGNEQIRKDTLGARIVE